jgi:hypothetical protein
MRDEIIEMCLARLREPPPSLSEALADPGLSDGLLRLLRDCPPLLVVRQLIAEIESRR